MDNKDNLQLSGQSGQRQGTDRRQTTMPNWSGEERRAGYDRRRNWPLFNEWSSTLKRNIGRD